MNQRKKKKLKMGWTIRFLYYCIYDGDEYNFTCWIINVIILYGLMYCENLRNVIDYAEDVENWCGIMMHFILTCFLFKEYDLLFFKKKIIFWGQ